MIRPAALLFAVLLQVTVAAGADSNYSLRGHGEKISSQRADARGMGGAVAASPAPTPAGNPASLAYSDRTMFFGTFDSQWLHTEETPVAGTTLVREGYSHLVPNFGLSFTLPAGMGFGAAILVDRRRGGRIEQDAVIDDGAGGQPYEQIFETDGNLIRIPFLFAIERRGIGLGAGLDLLLVNSTTRWQNVFPEDSGYTSSNDLRESSLKGLGARFGAQVPITSWLRVGGWGALPAELSGEVTLRKDGDTDSGEVSKEDITGRFADAWSAGLQLGPFRGVRFLADWTYENWEDVEPVSPDDQYSDVTRFAGGLEWTRGIGGIQWPIRLGGRTEHLHARDGLGRRVRETVVTAGSGFAFASGRGNFDWFVEYGRRGEKDTNEYYEEIFRIGLTLTGLEEWGRRRPPDDEDW